MDILLARGEDRVLRFTVAINDEILDLTDYTAFFYVKDRIKDNDPIITKEGTITDEEAGELTVIIDSEDTDISPGDYHYELWVVDSSDNKYHTGMGRFVIEPILEIPA